MPRVITPALRRAIEEPRNEEQIIVLLEITHPEIAEPIRVANDVVSYYWDGHTYYGFPFEFEMLVDSNLVPRGQLRVQNVDQRMSEAILRLTSPPELSILVFAGSDFTEELSENRRLPVSADVEPEYEAHHLVFGDISVDAMAITGEVISFDMSNEPWPAIRSTADRLPGLDP